MNYTDRYLHEIANYSTLDVLLADVAVRIQLSPTDYQLAVDRYHVIHEWIEREDSPLFGVITDFYTQGGFAIGATVARHATDDEFDIDVMAQLDYRAEVDPEFVLATLDEAIRAERGSRYHNKADRKTRCSTVYYSDAMHLDVTPTVRLIGTNEKTGLIFHSKPEDPQEPKLTLLANPHGFAQWFIQQTPPDQNFGAFFEKRSLDHDRNRRSFQERADAAPVPDQCPAYRKSRAVIALQLIKRWRNLAYDRRHKSRRLPPSVLLAYYVAKQANKTNTLSEELSHQVERMIATLRAAQSRGGTIVERNPECPDDVLTDRWPANLSDQRLFIGELQSFAVKLERLRGDISLAETQKILEDLFGERPAQSVVKDHIGRAAKDVKSGGGRYLPGKAAIPAAVIGGSALANNVRSAPAHRFYGDNLEWPT